METTMSSQSLSTMLENAQKIFQLVDLTRLEENDSNENVLALIDKSKMGDVCVAGVCIYPEYIPLVKARLQELGNTQSKIVTVVNFPHGDKSLKSVKEETIKAIEDGADEIDLVLPYHLIQAGEDDQAKEFVKAIKEVCSNNVLKVIIESGELKDPLLIEHASYAVINAGAEFVKTSTGKVRVNATPEACEVILNCISRSGKNVSFKAAGGVKDYETALAYIAQANSIMGENWVTPDTFRIGASSLVDSLPL